MAKKISEDHVQNLHDPTGPLSSFLNSRTPQQTMLILGAIVLLGLVLRLRYAGHYPNWDEAIHLIEVRQLVKFHSLTLDWLVRPPVFSIYASALAFIFGPKQWVVESVSVLASLVSIILVYKIGSEFVNKTVGIGATFLLAVMPMNAWYSTWVKQDALMTTFMLVSVYLFLKRRILFSGIALGLAILTKEPAAILIGILFIFALISRNREDWRAFFTISVVAIVTAGWWLLVYKSDVGHGLTLLFGTTTDARQWYAPFYEYLIRLPLDIGIGAFLALLVGLYFAIRRPGELKNNSAILLALIWAVLIYGFYSVAYAKEPWNFYAATPAIALIGALGLVSLESLLGWTGKSHLYKLVPRASSGIYFVAAVIALALVSAGLNYTQLLSQKGKRFSGGASLLAVEGKELAGVIRPKDRIALSLGNPVIAWYSGADARRIFMIPGGRLRDVGEGPEPETLRGKQMFERFIVRSKIDWVVLKETDAQFRSQMALLREKGVPFKRAGSSYIFNTSKLHK